MKVSVFEDIPNVIEQTRLAVNEQIDKLDMHGQKLATIERHLPNMIQEILEYYFDKKVAEHQANLVTMEYFQEKVGGKLDASIFDSYVKRMENKKIEDNTFKLEERIHKIEVSLNDFVSQDDHRLDLEKKTDTLDLDALREELHKVQS